MTSESREALTYRAAQKVREIAEAKGRDPVVMLIETLMRIDADGIAEWLGER